MARFLQPFFIYGMGVLVFWLGQLILFKSDYWSALYVFVYLLPTLLIPTLFGYSIHRKFSQLKLFGGALSGLIISSLSISFLAGTLFIIGKMTEADNGTESLFPPEALAVVILLYGLMFVVPLGMGAGCIYYLLFIKGKLPYN